ncbi:MAG TPA: M48 family metalloprotease [Sphingomicrobium sp.]|nr:M48 family metalloprotease [Sphingomicrobium sp.]
MRKALLFLSATAVAMSGTAVPAQYAPRSLDPRLVAEAQKDNAEIVQQYGGAESGQRAAYVDEIGHKVAAFSGIANPGAAYRFTLLNSAVENAFSVPGGYIYVTRQLLTLMDDEAELAFVLGHETGHVAAGHAQQRERAENQAVWRQLPWILLGGIFGGNIGNAVATRGLLTAKLQTLKFSREQEYQADTLGMRYMIAAGYDPSGAAEILAALTRNSALQARIQGNDSRKLPEWASTHPLSENRMQRELTEARATGRLGTGLVNRDRFLAQLDGAFVDDDPAQGVIDGRTFTHPDLRIQFTVPVGYLMDNGTDAVSISGSAGEAEFSGGRYRGTLENYIGAVLQALAGNQRLAVPPPRRTVINGIPAAYTVTRANSGSGPVDVAVVAYQWAPDTIYNFVMLTSAGSGFGPFASMISSIRKITPAEASAIRPRIIDVVTVKPGDTIQSLSQRMAYRNFQVDRFLALNGLAPNTQLRPGQKLKVVVYGERRS